MKTKMDHLMVDIETMGNTSFSSIVSIAALEFNINTSETGQSFYCNISLESCIDSGLSVDGDTIMWWLSKDQAARDKLLEEPRLHIRDALQEFSDFIKDKNIQIWGRSPRFDLGLLSDAYGKLYTKYEIPWDMRNERDVRTLESFAPEVKKQVLHNHKGVAHDALDDCYVQIKYCSEIWKQLNL